MDASNVLSSLDNAMSSAAAAGDETLSNGIAGFKNQIANTWTLNPYMNDGSLMMTGAKDFRKMSPSDLLQVKRDIDGFVNYNPLLSPSLRSAQFGARTAAKETLNAAVPDVIPLNKQATNLYAAQDILRRSAPTPDLLAAGVMGDVAGHVIGSAGGPLAAVNILRRASKMTGPATGLAAVSRGLGNLASSPAFRTAAAGYLGDRDTNDAMMCRTTLRQIP